jgi:hypothetical protein
MISYREQACIHFHQMLYIRAIDPHVAGTQPICRPAGDNRDRPLAERGARSLAGGCGDGFSGHKLSSHSVPWRDGGKSGLSELGSATRFFALYQGMTLVVP